MSQPPYPRQPGYMPNGGYQPPQGPPGPPPGSGWGGPPGGPLMPPQGPPPKKRHVLRAAVLLSIGAFLVCLVVVSAALSGHGNGTPAASPGGTSPVPGAPTASQAAAPKSAPTRAAPPTVTYTVTGSSADVTYGPAGSDYSGAVPMTKTAPLESPSYYAISAQLQGGGAVACSIAVNGKVIDHAEATGGYNIADCQIQQDPFSGKWESSNG